MTIYSKLKHKHSFNSPLILDVGANSGLEAKKLFDTYGPDCKVILVEPTLEVVVDALNNIKSWGLENKMFVEHTCLDLEEGFKEFGFHVSGGLHGKKNGSLEPFNWKAFPCDGKYIVRTKTLDQICPNPSIVKVDIERYEYIVLPTIVKVPTIEVLFVELHSPHDPKNLIEWLDYILKDTGLQVTGWYDVHQNHALSKEDSITEISPVPQLLNGAWKTIVIERVSN